MHTVSRFSFASQWRLPANVLSGAEAGTMSRGAIGNATPWDAGVMGGRGRTGEGCTSLRKPRATGTKYGT